jgi:3'-5' exoribonuclease
MSKQFVNSFEDKQPIQSVFLVKEKFLLKGKNGKNYLSVVFADRTGAIDGRIWDNVDETASLFQTGDFVRVKGMVQLFQNRKQLVVHKVERAPTGEFDLKDFVQVSAVDPKEMFARLLELVQSIRDPRIKQLTLDVIQDPTIQPKLLQYPAAKTIHHAYWGGLLEHILSICQIMQFLSEHYPKLNRDLLYFGAIFHDVGKLWELDYEGGTTYTDGGRMLGHLVMAVELVEKFAARQSDFSEELKMVLKHIVLSHHGKLEYGSPKTPQFLEAFIVAFIDDFDSKVNTIQMFIENERQTGEKWSRFHQLFERYFYLGITRDHAFGSLVEKKVAAEKSEKTWTNGSAKEETPLSSLVIPEGHTGLSYKPRDS